MNVKYDRPSLLKRALDYYLHKVEKVAEDEDIGVGNAELLSSNFQLEIENVKKLIDILQDRSKGPKDFSFDDVRHVLCRAIQCYLADLKKSALEVNKAVGLEIPLTFVANEIALIEKEHLTELCNKERLAYSSDPTKGGYVYPPSDF